MSLASEEKAAKDLHDDRLLAYLGTYGPVGSWDAVMRDLPLHRKLASIARLQKKNLVEQKETGEWLKK